MGPKCMACCCMCPGLCMFCRYGLPVNFQAMLLLPHKKTMRRLREELNRLYEHLDNTALSPMDVSIVHVLQAETLKLREI